MISVLNMRKWKLELEFEPTPESKVSVVHTMAHYSSNFTDEENKRHKALPPYLSSHKCSSRDCSKTCFSQMLPL